MLKLFKYYTFYSLKNLIKQKFSHESVDSPYNCMIASSSSMPGNNILDFEYYPIISLKNSRRSFDIDPFIQSRHAFLLQQKNCQQQQQLQDNVPPDLLNQQTNNNAFVSLPHFNFLGQVSSTTTLAPESRKLSQKKSWRPLLINKSFSVDSASKNISICNKRCPLNTDHQRQLVYQEIDMYRMQVLEQDDFINKTNKTQSATSSIIVNNRQKKDVKCFESTLQNQSSLTKNKDFCSRESLQNG